MKIPEQYLPVMPYLIVSDGNEFLSFAKDVFGAEEQHLSNRDDGSFGHAEIRINEAVVMFGEASGNWSVKPSGMFIYVDDVDKIYDAALRNNAISLMPPVTQEYGYTAGVEDPFGNHWWLVQGEN